MYDVNKIREQFPMLKNKKMQGNNLVYLDNASTTFKPQCVIDAIDDYYLNQNANSHRGDYDLMFNVDKRIQETRETIAQFINSESREVVFTSGDTMALNLVARAYGLKFLKPGDEIIVSEAEHASNLLPWYEVSHLTGAIIKFVSIDDNQCITLDSLRKILSPKTKVVSLAQISNVLGTSIDIKEFAKEIHKVGAIFVVDGAQSVPHIKVDFKDSDVDFLTFSAHKMCGPTGIGCLIGKYELLQNMDPYILGGGMNITFNRETEIFPLEAPFKFEAGTLNISGIFGFKAAVEFIQSVGMDNIANHDRELCEYTLDKLEKCEDIIIYNKNSKNGIVTFNKKGIFAQDEATLLNSKGIAIRSGEHCAKVLKNYLHTPATCRMSTYLYTTKEEIDIFVDAVINGGDILDAYFK